MVRLCVRGSVRGVCVRERCGGGLSGDCQDQWPPPPQGHGSRTADRWLGAQPVMSVTAGVHKVMFLPPLKGCLLFFLSSNWQMRNCEKSVCVCVSVCVCMRGNRPPGAAVVVIFGNPLVDLADWWLTCWKVTTTFFWGFVLSGGGVNARPNWSYGLSGGVNRGEEEKEEKKEEEKEKKEELWGKRK